MIVRSACGGSAGGRLISLISTLKVLASLSLGEPSSVTITVIAFVPGPSASEGVQVKTPLGGLMTPPSGVWLRLKVRPSDGPSPSVAAAGKLSVPPYLATWLVSDAGTGGT